MRSGGSLGGKRYRIVGEGGIRLSGVALLALGLWLSSCGDSDEGTVGTNKRDGGTPTKKPSKSGSSGSGPVTPVKPQVMDAGTALTCDDLNCGLHGDCSVDEVGHAKCVCDKGYVAEAASGADEGACVEDTSCVTARMLQCLWNEGSAIRAHFSLSYCSGTPYTGLDVSDLIVEEKGNEDFEQLLPSESSAAIITHDTLFHVYLALDVSNSIVESNVLGDVATGVKALIDELKTTGERYRFAVYLFDGASYLYPFIRDTDDLDAARKALDELPKQVGHDPSSSNVYGAVIEGVHELERARALRDLVNSYGLLSVGNLIVVSDGDDRSSTRTFEQAQAAVNSTTSSVITVGIGDMAKYVKLTAIGRDGSYSATQPKLITAAFDQIAERIKLVGQSLYLLGYCTPKRQGPFVTRIGVKNLTFDQPLCNFNADGFVPACSAESFLPASCDGYECGPGCGECGPGTCCLHGHCVAPAPLVEEDACGVEWMCGPGLTCAKDKCTATVGAGVACGSSELCDLDQTYCGVPDPEEKPLPPKTCQPARADGAACMAGVECKSLHCGVDPNEPVAASNKCLPPAHMFAPCGPNIGCEPGSYCDGKICQPEITGGSCKVNAQCRTGRCDEIGTGATVCFSAASCLFSLNL